MSRLAVGRKSQLSDKELETLSESMQLFDQSKYKSSLKHAESILAAHPDHAEAQAVKALCMAQFPSSQAPSVEVARKATRNNMRSYLCWHSLAVCHRRNRQYAEAHKAYSQAFKLEPRSAMMAREAASMLVMMRDHKPVIDFRLSFLQMQPHQRSSWVQLAVSHHLAGSLDQAIRVMEEYESVIKERPAKSFDQSETLLYHATLLIEAERYEEAIDLLDLNLEEILDSNARAELMGLGFLKTNKLPEAAEQYHWLLERNPHSIAYVEGYLLAKGVDTSEKSVSQQVVLSLVQELEAAWPESLAIRSIALKLLSGEEFEKRVETHFVRACQKGVPSLFNSLKQFYSNADKRSIIGRVAEKHRLNWQEAALSEEDDLTESPSAYLWSLYYLAQHYSYIGNADRAKVYIQSAIAHTPILPELHMTRARILKRSGDLRAAADAAETARLLDGQDRYVNCKATKYALRINDWDTAVDRAGKFTMKSSPSPQADLIDMQAFWFMTEQAATFIRQGQYALALKHLRIIEEAKQGLWAEQAEFHNWSIRKFTLRAYHQAVEWWDSTRAHPAATKAQLQTVDLCCKLHDQPELVQREVDASTQEQSNGNDDKLQTEQDTPAPKMSAGQKKKLKAKQKAQAAKLDATNEALEPKLPDSDPQGVQALKALKPLDLARDTCAALQEIAPNNVNTWLASFEWAARAENWLAAVRAAKQVHRLEPDHPDLHLATLRLAVSKPHLSSGGKGVKVAFGQALSSLTDGSPEALHAKFIQQHPDSPSHTLAAAQGLLVLAPAHQGNPSARRDEMIELLLSLPKQSQQHAAPIARRDIDGRTSSYKDQNLLTLTSGLDLLRTPAVAASDQAVQEYLVGARQLWPNCDAFKDEAILAQEAEERSRARQQWDAVSDDTQNGKARQA